MFWEFRTQGLAGPRTSEEVRAESPGERVAGLACPGLRGTRPPESRASGPPGLWARKESAAFTSRLNLQGRAERQEEAWRARSGHLLLQEEADQSSASKRWCSGRGSLHPTLHPPTSHYAAERDTETRQPPGLPGLPVAASDSLLSTPLSYKSTVYLGVGRGWRSKEIILAG